MRLPSTRQRARLSLSRHETHVTYHTVHAHSHANAHTAPRDLKHPIPDEIQQQPRPRYTRSTHATGDVHGNPSHCKLSVAQAEDE